MSIIIKVLVLTIILKKKMMANYLFFQRKANHVCNGATNIIIQNIFAFNMKYDEWCLLITD